MNFKYKNSSDFWLIFSKYKTSKICVLFFFFLLQRCERLIWEYCLLAMANNSENENQLFDKYLNSMLWQCLPSCKATFYDVPLNLSYMRIHFVCRLMGSIPNLHIPVTFVSLFFLCHYNNFIWNSECSIVRIELGIFI